MMDMFSVSVTTSPSIPQAGSNTNLTFTIRDDMSNKLLSWNDLNVDSGRKLHVVIVGEDLDVFGHVHVEDFIASIPSEMTDFSVSFTFPRAGTYGVLVGFLPKSQSDSMDLQRVLTIKVEGSPTMTSPKLDNNTEVSLKYYTMDGVDRFTQTYVLSDAIVTSTNDDAYHAAVIFNKNMIIQSGACVLLQFMFYNGTDKSVPLTDLSEYLEHPMHLVAIHQDLTVMKHFHGFVPMDDKPVEPDCNMESMTMTMNSFGPVIYASYIFPKPGVYRLFAQTTRKGKMLAPGFTVNVESSANLTSLTTPRLYFFVTLLILIIQYLL